MNLFSTRICLSVTSPNLARAGLASAKNLILRGKKMTGITDNRDKRPFKNKIPLRCSLRSRTFLFKKFVQKTLFATRTVKMQTVPKRRAQPKAD